jgi:hypothetical protein
MAALGCSALRLLAPKVCGKVFGLVVSSFFLCALVAPLMNLNAVAIPDFSGLPSDASNALLQDRVNAQLCEQVERAVQVVAEEALSIRNAAAKKVDVTTDISADGSISIEQVTLVVDKQTVPIAAVVREVLERQLETTIVIKTEE